MKLEFVYIAVILVVLVVGLIWAYRKYLRKGVRKAGEIKKPETVMSSLASTLKKVQEAKAQSSEKIELPEVISRDGVINAVVVDGKTRKFGARHVELKPNVNYGRQWDYAPHTGIYFLYRDRDGKITPVTPWEVISDSPSELYEAVQTTDDMTEVFGWLDEGSDKFKLIYLIIAALVALFIAFMALTYKKPAKSAELNHIMALANMAFNWIKGI